ncbi:MAG: prolyl oligopeptidase family serine peptidase [Prolixibacteraceae bacterium]|nr:prolyl oligopeptidase family serine peptidase [Prolixibacteraceae bacterium]
MKNTILLKYLALLISVAFIASCDLLNPEEEPQPTDEYLVSYDRQKVLIPSIIKIALQTQSESYPEIQPLIDQMEHSVYVYEISYNTTFQGEPVVASGLVAVPTTNGIEFPVLSYQNGTYTLDSLAPTKDPDGDLFLMLESIASTGFIVSLPDYIGFGESAHLFHPYMHKESTVQAVIDMLKAVKELVNNHLLYEMSDDLYITGYSKGGWATMQLQKTIETQYASEYNLKASACAAGPYDLNYINDYVLDRATYPMPYFLGYIFNSYSNLGIVTTPLSAVFNSPYDNIVSTIYDGMHSGEEINAELTTSVNSLFTDDYRNNYSTNAKFSTVVSSMNANSITAWNTKIPTMIIHGTNDDFISQEVSLRIYQDFIDRGVSTDIISYVPLAGLGHTSGVIPAELKVINWFLDLKDAE